MHSILPGEVYYHKMPEMMSIAPIAVHEQGSYNTYGQLVYTLD